MKNKTGNTTVLLCKSVVLFLQLACGAQVWSSAQNRGNRTEREVWGSQQGW